MNIEEIKERLKENIDTLEKLKQKYTVEDENNQNQEIENIDEAIEKYELEVNDLKEKLANEDNYLKEKNGLVANDRKVIEDLLADSFSQEREDIFKSSQLYRKQQDQQSKMLGIYNAELITLKDEIKDIEARLNKDAIAKKNGIAKKLHLSDEEVSALQIEKNKKLEIIEMSSQIMEICAEEIRRYGKLINENNSRLNEIVKREQRLDELMTPKENDAHDLDRYAMRLDKDKLAKRLSALQALKNRKEFLLYNPSEEINKEIVKNKELFENLINTKKEDRQESIQAEEEKPSVQEQPPISSRLFAQIDADRELDNKTSDNLKFNEQSEVNNDQDNKQDESDFDKQEQTKNDNKSLVPINNQTRELIEIKDAPETLKKQKLSDKFLRLWRKWRDKAIALALAAAMTVTAGVSLSRMKEDDFDDIIPDKSASDTSDLPDYDVEINNNFTFETPNSNVDNNVSNDMDNVKQEEIFTDHQEIEQEKNTSFSVEPEIEQTVIKPVIKEETKIEDKPIVEPTESKNNNFYIPEVEVEPTVTDAELPSVEETTPSVQLDGIVNNSDIETTVLQTEGEFVEIALPNGEVAYVQYGDNAENVPEGITVKYIGTDMYIYSPIVNTKAL